MEKSVLRKMKKSLFIFALLSCGVFVHGDLCQESYCQCSEHDQDPLLKDVVCQCTEKQILNIGPQPSNGDRPKHNAVTPPIESAYLSIVGCHHVEIFSRTLNSLPNLKSINLTDITKAVLHPKLFESKSLNGASASSANLHTINIEKVRDLKVSGMTFEGLLLEDSLTLKDTTVQRLSSLSFNPDSVGKFNIINSNIERISLWGFKLKKCSEFNIVESNFVSLASGAINIVCSKFLVNKNYFGSLQDSSFNVQFGSAEIGENYFETFIGKPFSALQKMTDQDLLDSGLEESDVSFKLTENKFACNPTLPLNSLAFPAYTILTANPAHKISIKDNHFVCQCGRMDWLLGAVNNNIDVESIQSIEFLRDIHNSAGHCLECNIKKCNIVEKTFAEFSSNLHLERTINGPLKCSLNKPRPPETTPEPAVQMPEDSKIIMAGGSDVVLSSMYIIFISQILIGYLVHQ